MGAVNRNSIHIIVRSIWRCINPLTLASLDTKTCGIIPIHKNTGMRTSIKGMIRVGSIGNINRRSTRVCFNWKMKYLSKTDLLWHHLYFCKTSIIHLYLCQVFMTLYVFVSSFYIICTLVKILMHHLYLCQIFMTSYVFVSSFYIIIMYLCQIFYDTICTNLPVSNRHATGRLEQTSDVIIYQQNFFINFSHQSAKFLQEHHMQC